MTLSGGGDSQILFVDFAEAALRDLTFRDGQSEPGSNGGAISATDAILNIDNCSFINNRAGDFQGDSEGGAILARFTELNISNSVFTGNSATAPGGAISGDYFSSISISQSEFVGNGSYYGGGAISANGTLSLTNSIVAGNDTFEPEEEGTDGGGLRLRGSALISGSTIAGNRTDGSGGGISFDGTTLTIVDSTIANNGAFYYYGGSGGGLRVRGGDVVIRNSTITGNRAAGGRERRFGVAASRLEGTTGKARSTSPTASSSAIRSAAGAPPTPTSSARSRFPTGTAFSGSDVLGNVAGDRENVAAGAVSPPWTRTPAAG